MMDIGEIAAYDPKTEGFDRRIYHDKFMELFGKNPNEAYKLHDDLVDKIGGSVVDGNLTLDDYLHGKDGYFFRNPHLVAVVFVDGRFHAALSDEEYFGTDLDELAEKTDSFPAMFISHDNLERIMSAKNSFR